MRKGLVLEGGGLRALFTAGILDVMLEAGIEFDGLVGVSAGATFGCNFKSKQIGRSLRYNLRFIGDSRYMGWKTFLRDGNWVSAEFSYHYMPNVLDVLDFKTFSSNPTEFHVVSTDAQTGQSVYKRIDDANYEGLEWIRASASLPLISRPVEIGGKKLLDGGISDSIPLEYFQKQGFERNVVILTQPKGFRKKRTRLMPFIRLFMRKHPAIIQRISQRHEMYNAQLAYLKQQEEQGNILLICPSHTIPIGRTEQNAEKMKKVYQMGREMGESKLKEIKRFLEE